MTTLTTTTADASEHDTATAAATVWSSPVLQQLLRQCSADAAHYVDVDGPVDATQTLVRYDAPYALHDPARSVRARARADLTNKNNNNTKTTTTTMSNSSSSSSNNADDDVTAIDPNVRIVLDAVIVPRRWRDAEGVVWVQHASPCRASRMEAQQTHTRYRALRQQLLQQEQQQQQQQQQQHSDSAADDNNDSSSVSAARALLNAEAHMEVMRQVVCECWQRGLLLFYLHSERVAAQTAHRELLESRVGHALRLALTGERDAARVQGEMAALRAHMDAQVAEEQKLRGMCDDFAAYAEEQMLIEEKQHSDAVALLRRDAAVKRAQLEAMVAVPPPM